MTQTCDEMRRHAAHATLTAWLNSKRFDKAMAMMSAHARSKKPGRAPQKIARFLAGGVEDGPAPFSTPSVVQWTKALKFVYAKALTRGTAQIGRAHV